jgi:hypothetical protein
MTLARLTRTALHRTNVRKELVLNKPNVIALAGNTALASITALQPIRAYLAQLAQPCKSCPKTAVPTLPEGVYRAFLASATLAAQAQTLMGLLGLTRLYLPGLGVQDRSPAT